MTAERKDSLFFIAHGFATASLAYWLDLALAQWIVFVVFSAATVYSARRFALGALVEIAESRSLTHMERLVKLNELTAEFDELMREARQEDNMDRLKAIKTRAYALREEIKAL